MRAISPATLADTGSVTITPGNTTATINVPINNDTLDENDGMMGQSVNSAALLADPDGGLWTGTSRGLEQGNGWTDWDMSFKDYKKGSALS